MGRRKFISHPHSSIIQASLNKGDSDNVCERQPSLPQVYRVLLRKGLRAVPALRKTSARTRWYRGWELAAHGPYPCWTWPHSMFKMSNICQHWRFLNKNLDVYLFLKNHKGIWKLFFHKNRLFSASSKIIRNSPKMQAIAEGIDTLWYIPIMDHYRATDMLNNMRAFTYVE